MVDTIPLSILPVRAVVGILFLSRDFCSLRRLQVSGLCSEDRGMMDVVLEVPRRTPREVFPSSINTDRSPILTDTVPARGTKWTCRRRQRRQLSTGPLLGVRCRVDWWKDILPEETRDHRLAVNTCRLWVAIALGYEHEVRSAIDALRTTCVASSELSDIVDAMGVLPYALSLRTGADIVSQLARLCTHTSIATATARRLACVMGLRRLLDIINDCVIRDPSAPLVDAPGPPTGACATSPKGRSGADECGLAFVHWAAIGGNLWSGWSDDNAWAAVDGSGDTVLHCAIAGAAIGDDETIAVGATRSTTVCDDRTTAVGDGWIAVAGDETAPCRGRTGAVDGGGRSNAVTRRRAAGRAPPAYMADLATHADFASARDIVGQGPAWRRSTVRGVGAVCAAAETIGAMGGRDTANGTPEPDGARETETAPGAPHEARGDASPSPLQWWYGGALFTRNARGWTAAHEAAGMAPAAGSGAAGGSGGAAGGETAAACKLDGVRMTCLFAVLNAATRHCTRNAGQRLRRAAAARRESTAGWTDKVLGSEILPSDWRVDLHAVETPGGARLMEVSDIVGQTPLHVAARAGAPREIAILVEFLVAEGWGDVVWWDDDAGCDALLYATSRRRHDAVLAVLGPFMANPSSKGAVRSVRRALQAAVADGFVAAVETFVQLLSSTDIDRTPLSIPLSSAAGNRPLVASIITQFPDARLYIGPFAAWPSPSPAGVHDGPHMDRSSNDPPFTLRADGREDPFAVRCLCAVAADDSAALCALLASRTPAATAAASGGGDGSGGPQMSGGGGRSGIGAGTDDGAFLAELFTQAVLHHRPATAHLLSRLTSIDTHLYTACLPSLKHSPYVWLSGLRPTHPLAGLTPHVAVSVGLSALPPVRPRAADPAAWEAAWHATVVMMMMMTAASAAGSGVTLTALESGIVSAARHGLPVEWLCEAGSILFGADGHVRLAACGGLREVCDALIDASDAGGARGARGTRARRSALIGAARGGHTAHVRTLLATGGPATPPDEEVLLAAIAGGDVDVCNLVIAAGALSAPRTDRLAVLYAARDNLRILDAICAALHAPALSTMSHRWCPARAQPPAFIITRCRFAHGICFTHAAPIRVSPEAAEVISRWGTLSELVDPAPYGINSPSPHLWMRALCRDGRRLVQWLDRSFIQRKSRPEADQWVRLRLMAGVGPPLAGPEANIVRSSRGSTFEFVSKYSTRGARSTDLFDALSSELGDAAVELCRYPLDYTQTDRSQRSLLHAAVISGVPSAASVVATLLNRGCNVHAVDSAGDTPLVTATRFALRDVSPIIALLLDAGADPNARGSDGVQPIHSVIRYGGIPANIGALVVGGADLSVPVATSNLGGAAVSSPLVVAAETHPSDGQFTARLLIAGGANVNARSPDGATPLIAAAISGREGVLTAILDARQNQKVDPSWWDCIASGLRTLPTKRVVAWRRLREAAAFDARVFVADIDAVDTAGYTALQYAIAGGDKRASIVQLLLAAGADMSMADRNLRLVPRNPSSSDESSITTTTPQPRQAPSSDTHHPRLSYLRSIGDDSKQYPNAFAFPFPPRSDVGK